MIYQSVLPSSYYFESVFCDCLYRDEAVFSSGASDISTPLSLSLVSSPSRVGNLIGEQNIFWDGLRNEDMCNTDDFRYVKSALTCQDRKSNIVDVNDKPKMIV